MSGTLPPILLKSSTENSTSDLSNKTNIESYAIDTKSKVRLSRRRGTRIRAHLHDNKLVPTSSLRVPHTSPFRGDGRVKQTAREIKKQINRM